MAGANRAQAVLVFSPTPVTAMPDKLTACVGDDALATLAAMGLTHVVVDILAGEGEQMTYKGNDHGTK